MKLDEQLNLWCDFVLHEGLMPAEIVDLLENKPVFTSTGIQYRHYDYRLIAHILRYNRLFNPLNPSPWNQDIKELAGDAFAGFDQTKLRWLRQISGLLEILNKRGNDTAHTQISCSNSLGGAVRDFIENCPDSFVPQEVREKYLQKLSAGSGFEIPLPQKSSQAPYRRQSPTKAPIENDISFTFKPASQVTFEEYLRHKHYNGKRDYKPNVVNEYANRVPGFLRKNYKIDLLKERNVHQVNAWLQELGQDDFFIEKNSHHTYSCGMQRYMDFLIWRDEHKNN